MNSLAKLTNKFFDKKEYRDNDIYLLGKVVQKFCETGKKDDAFSVYFCFSELFNIFGSKKKTGEKLLNLLADHEYHSGELLSKHRDHYSHSVYVFSLGLAIFANNISLRKTFIDFYKKNNFSEIDFLKYWGLVSLFHDVGYPFQLAHEQVKTYCIDIFGDNLSVLPRVGYENMDLLLYFKNNIKFDEHYFVDINELLAYGINKRLGYDYDIVKGVLCKRYRDKEEYLDHGYFSALLLTKQIVSSKKSISELFVDCLTAIALHNNLNRYDLKEELKINTSVVVEKHPFAYLLILCDELQNWDRTAFGLISKKDPLAWGIDLEITDDKIFVDYIFDKKYVLNSKEKKHEVYQNNRINENLTKKKKEKFIKDIYNVVVPHVDIDIGYLISNKNIKPKHLASTDKFMNIYRIAQAIHKSYQMQFGGENFEDLSLEFKLSNIEQAKSYAEKLELINCFYSDKEMDYPIIKGFDCGDDIETDKQRRKDLGFLAREEHIRWAKEKLEQGWKFGREGIDYTKDNRNILKLHKDLIPYDFLPEEEQKKDELMIQNMVRFLYHFGNGIRIYSFREGRKPVLNIAGCGHRTVKLSQEIKEQIKNILRSYQENYRVVVRTNFACGADQLISECANELGITIKATLPLPYEEYIKSIKHDAKEYGYTFTKEDEFKMRHLLAQTASCKVIRDEKYTYLEASKYIINKSDKLIALWDGVETKLKDENGNPINQGGTWHNICIAKDSRGLKDEDIHIIKCAR